MKHFIKIRELGTLMIDRVLFETYYPIFFICKNKNKDLFLCTCCTNNEDGKKWLISKTTNEIIKKILQNKIFLRDAFFEFNDVKFTVILNDKGTNIKKNDKEDWDYETSIYLPDKDEYFDE